MTDDTFGTPARNDGDSPDKFTDIGEKLFQLRDFTPIPLILILLFAASPSVRSATIGMVLITFGELVRIYSVAFIGSVSRTRNLATTGGALVTTGPFAMVRNPLYVGNFFITFGVAVFGGVFWLIALTFLAFGFQYFCIVRFEERLLVQKFGREYEEYRNSVPAWIPAHLPSLDALPWPDTFSPALKSERRTLAAIGVMILALMIFGGGR